MTSIRKFGPLAEDFLVASGILSDLAMGESTKVGRKIEAALTDKEANAVENIIMGVMFGEKERYASMVKLANIFAKVSARSSLDKDLSGFVPVDMTDERTANDIAASGAKDFANLVKVARTNKGLK